MITRETIESRISQAERDHDARVLFACESGSRAWGFASTDSDYDVRFVYVQRRDWYLSVRPGRDVIEYPIVDDLDVSGWELRKALTLLRKSNPPLLEWLASPIIYREVTDLAAQMRLLRERHFSPRACVHHYLSMAKRNFRGYLREAEVRRKKYLYVLRPILACRWIQETDTMAPTEFSKLTELVQDDSVASAIHDLVEEKKAGTELGTGPGIPVLTDFCAHEIERLGNEVSGLREGEALEYEQLDLLFRQMLDAAWG